MKTAIAERRRKRMGLVGLVLITTGLLLLTLLFTGSLAHAGLILNGQVEGQNFYAVATGFLADDGNCGK